jgi:hypothetical protein
MLQRTSLAEQQNTRVKDFKWKILFDDTRLSAVYESLDRPTRPAHPG